MMSEATDAVISALRAAVAKQQANAAQAAIMAKEAERAAAEAEWRLMVVTDHQPDPDQTVSQRVRAFLEKYPEKKFSPRELMVATRSGEDSVRRALVSFGKLTTEAGYIRHGHAEYAFDPRHRKPS